VDSRDLLDHLGSLRDVTDANGNLLTEYDYDLWGNRTRIHGTPDFNLGLTGHWVIEDLVFAPFRTYNPYSGRWISRDPLGESGGINLYRYVGNDPVNAVDPLGLDGKFEWPIGTPSVTGLSFLNQPGRAGQEYKPDVRIHQKGASGRADSLGCITADRNSVDAVKRVMDYEISRGERLYLKIVLWSGVPYALPR